MYVSNIWHNSSWQTTRNNRRKLERRCCKGAESNTKRYKNKDQIKDAITTPFTSKIQTQQGDSYSGPQLELYFENSLRKVRKESGILNQKDLSEEMIYDDDFDNFTEDLEKKRKFKEILGNYWEK